MMPQREDVLDAVAGFIHEIVGEDFELEDPITEATSFSDDLELESIEFVALAELLQKRYGEKVDFVGWISHKELDEIIALKVGDLVEFILFCHRSAQTT